MMTEEGKATYELVNSYGLGAYYNEYVGNVLIPMCDFNKEQIRDTALKFLTQNEDWVMGCETETWAVYRDGTADTTTYVYLVERKYLE